MLCRLDPNVGPISDPEVLHILREREAHLGAAGKSLLAEQQVGAPMQATIAVHYALIHVLAIDRLTHISAKRHQQHLADNKLKPSKTLSRYACRAGMAGVV